MSENFPKINCDFATENALYRAYMPFIRDGGIFVHTNLILPLDTKVSLYISLLNELDPHVIEAKVIWITPRGAQNNKPAGLGFQFIGEKCYQFRNHIESNIAEMLKSIQVNDTM